MKKRRFSVWILCILSAAACALGLAGCNLGGEKGGHAHSYTATVVEETCTEQGYTRYVCSCGDNYTDKFTDPLGHDVSKHRAQAATCENVGWEDYETCSRCDYTTYKEISALGHDEVHHEGKEESCTEEGYLPYVTCTRCDYSTYQTIPMRNHALNTYGEKEPTCTEVGWYAYEECQNCDYTTYQERPALGHDEVFHNGSAATCLHPGYGDYVTCTRCDYSTYQDISALGHDYAKTFTVDVQPTCTRNGIQSKHCSRCEAVTEQTEIDALGHDTVEHAGQEATCTEDGWTPYETCTRCDYTTYQVIFGRHDVVFHPGQEPDCENVGWNDYESCTRCDYTTYREIPARGHDFNTVEKREPTCTRFGWTEYEECSRCNKTRGYTFLSELGHDYSKEVTNVEPTCETEGSKSKYCVRCGDKGSVVAIPALGHSYGSWQADSAYHTGVCARCQSSCKEIHDLDGHVCTTCKSEIEFTDGLKIIDNGTYCSVNGRGTATDRDIVIPAVYNGKLVTAIYGSYIFNDRELTSVTIPETITDISYRAFGDDCGAVIYCEAQSLPQDWGADWKANSLPVVWDCKNNDRDSEGYLYVFIDGFRYRLKDTTAIVYKQIPSEIAGTVTMPSQVTYEDTTYFVKGLSDEAFKKCTSLTGVTFPFYENAIESIGREAFAYSGIKKLTIPRGVTVVSPMLCYDCKDLTSVIIPSTVKTIGGSAFHGCSGLTEAEILNGTETIEYAAFYNCSGLTSLWLPKSVKVIKDNAFNGCASLKTLTTADDSQISEIGAMSFSGCPVETLRAQAIVFIYLGDRSNLVSVTITKGSLGGENAFRLAKGLKSVTLMSGVERVAAKVFNDCHGLTIRCESASAPSGWASGWNGTCAVVWDCLNNNVASDGYIYEFVEGIRYRFKDGVAEVPDQPVALTGDVVIPETVVYDQTTYSVTGFTYDAFADCNFITSVSIPKSVTKMETIKSMIYGDAYRRLFYGCTALESITVASDNTVYRSAGNCIVELATGKLITGCKNSVIPADGSVTSIADFAFDACSGLENIVIPDSVLTIGEAAFRGCALVNVTIPDSVTTIGEYAFERCTALQSVVLGNGIKTLNYGLFYNCSSLETCKIPSSVERMSRDVFYGCSNLIQLENDVYYVDTWVISSSRQTGSDITDLCVREGTVGVADYAFSYYNAAKTVTLPDSLLHLGSISFNASAPVETFTTPMRFVKGYVNKENIKTLIITSGEDIPDNMCLQWNNLAHVTVPDNLKTIGERAFAGCSALTDFLLTPDEDGGWRKPNQITSIGREAFSGCTSLQSFYIPEGVTRIEYGTFKGCYSLISVSLPNSIVYVDETAFAGCEYLVYIFYDGDNAIQDWLKVEIAYDWDTDLPEDFKLICNVNHLEYSKVDLKKMMFPNGRP